MTHFRKDIHLLRGVAALLVVLYHADLGLSGGFIGVDLFFVISGYLITNHLLELRERHPQDWVAKFLGRRFWRLVPVALVGVSITLALSLLMLAPFGEQQPAIRTGWSSLAFLANVELNLNQNYWVTSRNPLLHMWSLGVEAQFYFGILLFMVTSAFLKTRSRFAKNMKQVEILNFIFILAMCASFSLSLAASFDFSAIPLAKPFAFYGSPTRLWEFLAGGILATQQKQLKELPNGWAKPFLVAGWIAISAGLAIARPDSVFPGWIALLPVFGVGMLIAAGGIQSKFSPVQELRIFQHLGDISYSWYVVHFPILVFAKILFPDSSILERVTWVILTYFLGLVTFKCVEKPMRQMSIATRKKQLMTGFSLVTVSVIVVSLLSIGSVALRSWWNPEPFYSGVRDEVELLGNCLDSPIPIDMGENCVWNGGANKPRLMLLGDSQAASLASGLIAAATRIGAEIAIHSQGGCAFISPALDKNRCPTWDDRWQAIQNYKPDVLIVTNAWSTYPKESITDLVDAINANNQPTVLVHEAPSLGDPRETLASKVFRLPPISNDLEIQDTYLRALTEIASTSELVSVLDPEAMLCPKTKCSIEMEHLRGVFYGGSHLSRKGANLLAQDLASHISALLRR
ncbi:MAG: acyltransferase [Chitinophagales bacterium]|nr:acyltransferase [Chitinophagales bacterium]